MTRRELIQKVNEGLREPLPAGRVNEVIERAFEVIAASIASEGRYVHPGFGSFTVRVTDARPGRSPRTGEPILIPGSVTVAFKPAAELRARVAPSPRPESEGEGA